MKREVLEAISEFNDLIKFHYDHQLADGVWRSLVILRLRIEEFLSLNRNH
jgi:hypothetical protein